MVARWRVQQQYIECEGLRVATAGAFIITFDRFQRDEQQSSRLLQFG